jgi:hypothetical protein
MAGYRACAFRWEIQELEDNIKMKYESTDWIEVTQDGVQRLTFVNTVVNLKGAMKRRMFDHLSKHQVSK